MDKEREEAREAMNGCCPRFCPVCKQEMEKVQVYDSMEAYYSDGPHHFEYHCKCGHQEAE